MGKGQATQAMWWEGFAGLLLPVPLVQSPVVGYTLSEAQGWLAVMPCYPCNVVGEACSLAILSHPPPRLLRLCDQGLGWSVLPLGVPVVHCLH